MKPARPEDIPTATHSGIWEIGDLKIKVHHLDDGRRIIDSEDLKKIIEWLACGDAELAAEIISALMPREFMGE